MKAARLFNRFFNSEKAGGILLVIVTIVSIIISNSSWQQAYKDFWQTGICGESIVHWINDGLMSFFFLLIGLELEREVYTGELSNLKSASLPFFAALGGMLVPAIIYLLFNYGTATQSGAGIPMATDIAFAVGILSLLGKRVPSSLKIFLTALAVMDDLGAIIVIAAFYSSTISFINLFIALGIFAVLLVLNRLKVHNLIPYLIGGVVMWYFMKQSGIHPTLTGVLVAFAIPFSTGSKRSASYILQDFLHIPVAFIILPLFAVANTEITLPVNWVEGLAYVSSIGIIAGLVIGKSLGISLFSFIAVKTGMSSMPAGANWKNITGIGLLAGIGFTMSIFITLLAFENEVSIINAKIAVLTGSVMSAILGLIWLSISLKKTTV